MVPRLVPGRLLQTAGRKYPSKQSPGTGQALGPGRTIGAKARAPRRFISLLSTVLQSLHVRNTRQGRLFHRNQSSGFSMCKIGALVSGAVELQDSRSSTSLELVNPLLCSSFPWGDRRCYIAAAARINYKRSFCLLCLCKCF